MNEKRKILVNAAKCLRCDDIIESKTVHDFQTCSCGSVSVDGGKEYLKRSWKMDESYVDMSVYDGSEIEFLNGLVEELEEQIEIQKTQIHNLKNVLSE